MPYITEINQKAHKSHSKRYSYSDVAETSIRPMYQIK